MLERLAELTLESVAEEDDVLLPDGSVETETDLELRKATLIAFLRCEKIDRVADHADAEEHDHRHREDDEDALDEATQDEDRQGAFRCAAGAAASLK
jgi:Mn-dependent DtxR family transcriptional regulator